MKMHSKYNRTDRQTIEMEVDNARVGDEFMRQIETAASYVLYMICPGNHENA